MKNKGLWNLLGFSLFIIGATACVMQAIGVQWAFLSFLEMAGRGVGFVAKLLIFLSGILIVVLANTDWERERRESE